MKKQKECPGWAIGSFREDTLLPDVVAYYVNRNNSLAAEVRAGVFKSHLTGRVENIYCVTFLSRELGTCFGKKSFAAPGKMPQEAQEYISSVLH